MEDQILISELQKGNEQAYKQIFIKFYSPLCEYASHYISDFDSEELVQDFMLYIWENREYLYIESSLKAYFFKSIKNRCFNAIRNQQYKEKKQTILQERLGEQFEDYDYYFINDLSEAIKKAIDELPENYQEVFRLSRFGDMKNAEIAKELSVSVKTVEYRITQSLKILRVKLKDYLCFFPFFR
jgi:RNA polymerase sigma-70 factor (ECF subfamily)